MKPMNANEVDYEEFEILGWEALFTNMRIDRNTLPDGLYAYDLRDECNGEPNELKSFVLVNHWGINLAKTAREVALHEGNVWTHVVSLRRDDAERMGYNALPVWRDLVKRHIDDIAAAQKIERRNLKWYAAFHDKENNPHVHIVVYSQNPKEGF